VRVAPLNSCPVSFNSMPSFQRHSTVVGVLASKAKKAGATWVPLMPSSIRILSCLIDSFVSVAGRHDLWHHGMADQFAV
jgi:hypothetical protein